MDYFEHELGEGFDEEAFFDFEDFEDEEGLFEGETGPLVRREAKRAIQSAKKSLKQAKVTPQKVVQNAAKAAGAAVAGKKGAQVALKAAKQAAASPSREDESEAEALFESLGGDFEIYDQMQYLAQRAAEAESEGEADEWIGAVASLAGPLINSLLGEAEQEGFDDQEDFEGYEDYENFEDHENFEAHEDYEDYEDYEAAGEGERDEFFPLLAKAVPMLAKVAAPLVKRGIGAIGRALSSRRTRGLVRRLPNMALTTANALARQARAGRPITPTRVAATLGRQACRTFMVPMRRPRPRVRYQN
jgi:hypothetical protein